jgi:hypothetical protein
MPEKDLVRLLNERMDAKFAKRDRENGENMTRNPFQLGPRDLSEAMLVMNNLLDRYRLQLQVIPRKFFEVDNIKYWTLISTGDDEIVKDTGAKALKEWQLVLLKQTLDMIIESDDGFVRVNEVMSNAKRPNLEVEAFLNEMVEDQWLARSKRAGLVTAGIRSLTELAEYMKAMGAFMCKVNNIPVIRTAFYKRTFNRGSRGDDDDDEEEEEEEEEEARVALSSTKGKRKARSRITPVAEEDDDDDEEEEEEDDDDEEEEEEEEPTPTRRGRSRRRS